MKPAWLKLAFLVVGVCVFSTPSYSEENEAWEDVVSRVLPSVVKIEAQSKTKTHLIRKSFGSGFLIHEDGYIVCSYHTIADVREATITFFDGEDTISEAIYGDAASDIAIIKVDPNLVEDLTPLQWGESETARVSQDIRAIGYPFGSDYSVTSGIISAKNRELGLRSHEDFIETDAVINSGNSGGPLINKEGRIIGVVDVMRYKSEKKSAEKSGINYAISSQIARFVSNQLITYQKVGRGHLGVHLRSITAEEKDFLGVSTGAAVRKLASQTSPAGNAGIEPDDIILDVNGVTVLSSQHLCLLIGTTAPRTQVTLAIQRGEETSQLEVTLGEQPDSADGGKTGQLPP